jgi:hypothetical protein
MVELVEDVEIGVVHFQFVDNLCELFVAPVHTHISASVVWYVPAPVLVDLVCG